MKLQISRAKWLRGEGAKGSFLLRQLDGKMCCLGFYALAQGHTVEQIAGCAMPMLMGVSWKGAGLVLDTFTGRVSHSSILSSLMAYNDMERELGAWREKQIKDLFLALDGTEVEFID